MKMTEVWEPLAKAWLHCRGTKKKEARKVAKKGSLQAKKRRILNGTT